MFSAWVVPHSSASSADTRALSVVGDSFNSFFHYAYTCEVSKYGYPLDEDRIYRAVLMRPYGDPYLCELPDYLAPGETNLTLPVDFRTPVALMVSRGGDCDIHTKIDVALQIQEFASRSVKYIIFYNNDPDNNDSIVPIVPPSSSSGVEIPENVQRLSFLSVSTSAGSNIMGFMQKYAEDTGSNPDFLLDGNILWDLYMLVEQPPLPSNPPPPNSRVNSENFYWFRLILFALLIMSPCCRGAYLWWNGGGRIYFRRNENGRIVGLQYISPISYWFASNGAQDASSPVMDRLTEEQVRALPEIIYKVPIQTESEGSSEENAKNEEESGGDAEDVDILVSSGSADEKEDARKAGNLERIPSVSESLRGSDEEQLPDEGNVTNCTTCSICIEEFENGERLRFLPRCKHAFHTECIMPWLTERQGCCPLCKTSVLEQDDSGDSDTGRELTAEETDQSRNGSQNGAGTEAESTNALPRLQEEDEEPAPNSRELGQVATRIASSGSGTDSGGDDETHDQSPENRAVDEANLAEGNGDRGEKASCTAEREAAS